MSDATCDCAAKVWQVIGIRAWTRRRSEMIIPAGEAVHPDNFHLRTCPVVRRG